MLYENATVVTIDFETYYAKDFTLAKMPTQNYINSDKFEVIGVAVKVDDCDTFWVDANDDIAGKLRFLELDKPGTITVAHNAMFDGAILEWKYHIKPWRYFCTQMGSRPIISPYTPKGSVSLANVAKTLKIGEKGTEVVNALGKRLKDFNPNELARYAKYCVNDVELTYKICNLLRKYIPETEAKLIDATVTKFTRPVIDLDLDVLNTRLVEVKNEKESLLEACGISDKTELRSAKRFAALLQEKGVTPPTKISERTGKETFAFAKNDLAFKELLSHPLPAVRALVETKLGIQSSQEETRLERFKGIAESMYESGHYFGTPLLYYGAHTGRFSGQDKLNLQNLPRGSALRKALVAPSGMKVVAGDLSQIEARMTAVLCGETDLIKQFANGEDVYSNFATKIYGYKVSKAQPQERFVGKTCILGLGYGTGHVKLCDTLKLAGVDVDLVTAKEYVNTYRSTFPKIKSMWGKLENVIMNMSQGSEGHITEYLPYKGNKITLPNGLKLVYNNLKVSEKGGYVYTSKGNEVTLYGAKLLENLVQALARIVISDAELFLYDRQYRAAMQVHDELIYVVSEEVAEKFSKVLFKVLTRQVDWMPDLPLDAEVAYGDSYYDCK